MRALIIVLATLVSACAVSSPAEDMVTADLCTEDDPGCEDSTAWRATYTIAYGQASYPNATPSTAWCVHDGDIAGPGTHCYARLDLVVVAVAVICYWPDYAGGPDCSIGLVSP